MTSDQIAAVRHTWAKLAPTTERAAAIFYDRLFELDPSVRALFAATDLGKHGPKFAQTVAIVVDLLDREDELLASLRTLGRRHASYGVGWRHYGLGADALFTALECCLGPAFTAEARAAWSVAYWIAARAMQRAAVQVA
jgi:hemoglobin-like flavoprotein